MATNKHYGDRDPEALEPHFGRHMQAMTREGLESKSAIAEELAWRDAEIERLQRNIGRGKIDLIEDAAEIIDTLTSRLEDGHPIREAAKQRAKARVAELYELAEALGRAEGQ